MTPLLRVRLTVAAQADLNDAVDQALLEGGERGARLAQAFETALAHLHRFPASGRPGKISGSREYLLPALPFILPYRVEGEVLVLLRLIHTSRQWPPRRATARKKR